MKVNDLGTYIDLIRSFLDSEITATDFKRKYLGYFKASTKAWGEGEYETLNTLFLDLDEFCADPSLRNSKDLDERQIRARSQNALKKLITLKSVCA